MLAARSGPARIGTLPEVIRASRPQHFSEDHSMLGLRGPAVFRRAQAQCPNQSVGNVSDRQLSHALCLHCMYDTEA
jgi:hypothetical protein